MSNLWHALYQGPIVVGSNSTRSPYKLGGANQSELLGQGRHPFETLESSASRENQKEINRRKAAAERAQKEYRNNIKKLINNLTEQKRKQTANKIAAAKQANELEKKASAKAREVKQREKAAALRKLKNNLRANRNRISINLRANYNAWASVWIKQLFNFEFNKDYLPPGEREELKEAINKVKKGLADVIKHDKELKNLKREANNAVRRNAEARRKAAEAALKRASPAMRQQENRRQINRMIAAARAANQASRTFRRQTPLFGPSNMRGRPKRA